jgi:hypothetical protein
MIYVIAVTDEKAVERWENEGGKVPGGSGET